MRALRVVGVTGDGSVVLEDPGRRERYTVPADEQLRAAARGDVTRLGQIAIELESQLRPREIQARIRGGASVDEVAAAAGVPTQKIERFAYPVLLERSRTAELAQGAHPQRADGPDSRTLGETVAHTFGLRGQDYTTAGWDSWKGEDGKWVVVLTWQTGRSDNAAHWAFQPGAHGGTVVPLDEHASDLIEGLPARPLRPLGAVVDMARDDGDNDETPEPAAAAPARAVAGGQAPPSPESWAGRGIAPEQRRSSPPPRPRVETPARSAPGRDEIRPPAADAPVIPRVEKTDEDTTAGSSSGAPEAGDSGTGARTADGPDLASVSDTGSGPGVVSAASNGVASASGAGAADSATRSEDSGSRTAAGVGSSAGSAATGAGSPDSSADTGTATAGSDVATPDSGAATADNGAAAAFSDAAAPDTDASASDIGSDGSGSVAHTGDPAASSAVDTPAATSADATSRTGAAADTAAADTGSSPNTGDTAHSASSTGTDSSATSTATGTGPSGGTGASADSAADAPGAAPETPQTGNAAATGAATGSVTGEEAPSATAPAAGSATTEARSDQDSPADGSGSSTTSSTGDDTASTEPATEPAGEAASRNEDPAPRQRGGSASRRTKKGKPVMPSWDEVLLGVRGQR